MRVQKISNYCTNNKNAYQLNNSNPVQFKGLSRSKSLAVGLAGLILAGCEKPTVKETNYLLRNHPEFIDALRMPPSGFEKLDCNIQIYRDEFESVRDLRAYAIQKFKELCGIDFQSQTHSYLYQKKVDSTFLHDVVEDRSVREHYKQMLLCGTLNVFHYPKNELGNAYLDLSTCVRGMDSRQDTYIRARAV